MAQLTVSVCELYGGFMTFVPDLLDGGRSLETRDPVLLWIYLVFMNGLWVWVPALLVWDSMGQLTHACDVAKTETMLTQRRALVKGLPSLAWFHFIAGRLTSSAYLHIPHQNITMLHKIWNGLPAQI